MTIIKHQDVLLAIQGKKLEWRHHIKYKKGLTIYIKINYIKCFQLKSMYLTLCYQPDIINFTNSS